MGVVVSSREVDGYAEHVLHSRFPRAIDWSYVRMLLGVQAAVAVGLLLVLRPWSYERGSRRALAGFVGLLLVAAYLTQGLMHALPEFGSLWGWVLAGVVGCGVLAAQRRAVTVPAANDPDE